MWNLTNCKLRANLQGHSGYINTVTVSPDGSLCASGGKVRPHLPIPIPFHSHQLCFQQKSVVVCIVLSKGHKFHGAVGQQSSAEETTGG